MKIAILGYGKMGRAIENVLESTDHEIVLKVRSSDKGWEGALKTADVAIEFTNPKSAVHNYKTCFAANLPVVSGTTGWLDEMPEIKKWCLQYGQAFFYAPNFSIGVNLFFELNRRLASMMQAHDYRAGIKEVHHTEKLDAPSGTAIQLALDLVAAHKGLRHWESSDANPLPDGDVLPVKSERLPGVPGIHIVSYSSAFDQIEIKHTALSREGFARGAVAAAEWIIGREGFFGMQNMLNDPLSKS